MPGAVKSCSSGSRFTEPGTANRPEPRTWNPNRSLCYDLQTVRGLSIVVMPWLPKPVRRVRSRSPLIFSSEFTRKIISPKPRSGEGGSYRPQVHVPAPMRTRDQRPGLTSSTIHPARWSRDRAADPGNRESQLRTDTADAQAVKPHDCPAGGLRGVRARRSPPCTRAIGSYSLMTLWQDQSVRVLSQ